MKSRYRFAACAILGLLQGCGGGSGASNAPVTIPIVGTPTGTGTPAPTPTPTPTPTPSPLPLTPEAAAFTCPAIEPMPRAMAIETQYAGASVDPTYSTLDPAKVAAQEAERAKFDRPVIKINSLSDRYYDTSDESLRQVIAPCLADHFAALSSSGAMLDADSDNDYYYREWMVSSLAVSWLRAQSRLEGASGASAVRAWFDESAGEIRSFHDRRRADRGSLDNHDYWGAAAVAGAGRITGRETDLSWSRTIMTAGLAQIDANGLLAAELARGKKATHYHVFAAVPLAATAILTGTDIETVAGNAFTRLAGRLANDLADPNGGLIATRTGVAQDEVNRGQLVFLASVLKTNAVLAQRLRGLGANDPLVSYFLGGDIGFLIDLTH